MQPDRATVCAVTPAPQRLRLTWTGASSGEATEEAPRTVHALLASGLAPSSEVRYRLLDERDELVGEGAFRTAPAAGAPATVTFVAFGDSGVTGRKADADDEDEGIAPNQWKVAASIAKGPAPDLVLHTGDLVYPEGEAHDFGAALFEPFAPLLARAPLYPTLGNHDVKTANAQPYLDFFSLPGDERSYAFERGDALFVSFEASHNLPPKGPLEWLERVLRESPRTWKVVFFHVPPFGPCRGDNPPVKDALVPLLARTKVDLVLSGHDHTYARYAPQDGVTYVVTGGGGARLYELRPDARLAASAAVYHHVEGVIERKTLRLRAVGIVGAELDRVALEKK